MKVPQTPCRPRWVDASQRSVRFSPWSNGTSRASRAMSTTCHGAARSASGSVRRDVSSVHSSAVDVRVTDLADVEVGAAPQAEEIEDGDAGARPSTSTSFRYDRDACDETKTTSTNFTSINEAKHQLKFILPNALSGCIIGKNGSNLERIRAQSGAFIQANAPGYAVSSHRMRFFIIAGDTMERCLHGLALLLESVKVADKMHLLKTNTIEDDPRFYLKQVIPGSCAGNVIGMKGGNIAKISRERGLSVFVEPKPLHATVVPFRIVSYAGSSVDQLVGGVQGVLEELYGVDAYMEQYTKQIKDIKSVVIRVVRIPSGRVGALIGPNGAHLHALQEVLKCRLALGRSEDVDAEHETMRLDAAAAGHQTKGYYLTVWGQPENVRAAVGVAKLHGGHEVRSRKPK